MTKLSYRWVTEPPIDVYEGETANPHIIRYGTTLLKHIRAYRIGITPPPDEPGSVKSHSTRNLDNAEAMCEMVIRSSCILDQIFCVYRIGLNPVALMILNPNRDDGYINDLVVHPGAASGGSIMLEFAVNHCVQKGIPPRLELWAYDEISVPAYRGMGLESVPGKPQDMYLDLTSGHDKWTLIEGKWRYLSSGSPGMMYMQGLMPPPPPVPPKPKKKSPPPVPPKPKKKSPPPLPPRPHT